MTIWGFKFALNWLLIPAAAWLAWKWRAAHKSGPGLQYLDHVPIKTRAPVIFTVEHAKYLDDLSSYLKWPSLHEKSKPIPKQPSELFFGSHLLRVKRTSVFLPRIALERWLVTPQQSTREGDGFVADERLHRSFLGMIEVAEASKAELEQLSKGRDAETQP